MHQRWLLATAAVLVAAVAAAIIVMLMGNGFGGSKGEAGNVLAVTDMLGRKVAVHLPVRRVVAVGPGALRLLVYLNVTDKVVGVEAVEKLWSPIGRPYIMAHPELRSLPVVGPGGPGKMPDVDAIASLKPDVVFVTFMPRELVDRLQEELNVPVVSLGSPVLLSLNDFGKIYRALELVGRILGVEDRARKAVSFIESVLADLRERVKDVESNVSVYVAGVGFKGKRGITSTWCHFPLFDLLNVRSIVDRLGCKPGHLEIERETLLELNPTVVFVDGNGLGLIVEDYMLHPDFYERLSAFARGNVYVLLPYNYYATNIELALADAYFIGKVLYPDRFKDVDPVEKANEIMEFLDGKPLFEQLKRFYHAFERINISVLASLASRG